MSGSALCSESLATKPGVIHYRRTQRLERARAMLEQTGCSVLEAAHASGYTSAANFATAFKKRFGLTPKLLKAKI